MDWETPAFEEIKMDAELSSYVNDLERDAAVPRPSEN
jgi:hypothetical protein